MRWPVIPAVPVLARPEARLLLVSASVLLTELILIRWIPANVVNVGLFSNFLLLASFLGIGLGILLGRRWSRPPAWPFHAALFTTVAVVLAAKFDLYVPTDQQIHFGLLGSPRVDANILVFPTVIALTVVVMTSLSLPLAALFRAVEPLRAYTSDIVGAILGIAIFALMSAAQLPPAVWFAVLGALLLLTRLGQRLPLRLGVVPVLFLAVVGMNAAHSVRSGDVWSPYYRVSLSGGTISVNGIPHQAMQSPRGGLRIDPFYEQVYDWFPSRTFDRALIVGAGSGSDVAFAISRGVRSIDAVEIDPHLVAIGVADHPDRPYDDPRVRRTVADGRAFLRNSDERYDLVVYALPDSLLLVTSTADLRLESFLFTREALESVRAHLRPDGVFVMYNYFREPWLIDRLAAMLEEVFGAAPIVRTFEAEGYSGGAAVLGAMGPLAPAPSGALRQAAAGTVVVPTDDWPFVYLQRPTVPTHYLVALVALLLFALAGVAAATRASGARTTRIDPHFFALGAAFLLLETRSIVTFGLLFGVTWWVNTLVFAAILLSVLAGIAVSARWRIVDPRGLYALLLGSLVLQWLVPPAAILFEPAALRYAVAGAFAFAPVFFANIVFARSFRTSAEADVAFASNLLGAIAGGALEYTALALGYRALIPLVAVLYVVVYAVRPTFVHRALAR